MRTVECRYALPWRQFARFCSLATILVLVSAAPKLAGQAPPLLTQLSYPTYDLNDPQGNEDNFGSPQSVAIADFNGDGVPDAAVFVFNGYASQIYIYLGNGDGTFQFPLATPIEPVESGSVQSYNTVSGDFNGDGKADLCIWPIGSSEVLVLLGNGDGTFQAPVASSFGSNKVSFPAPLITGDFNGDGKLDLAAVFSASGPGDVYLLPGNGDGTFSAPVQLTQTGTNGPALASADLRQNGDLDLVFSIPGGFGVALGDGKGGFSAVTPYAVPGTLDGVGLLRIDDFNGDGIPDIFAGFPVSGPGHTNWSVAAFPGAGDGTFGAGVITPTNMGITSELGDAVADFNGDGIPDYFDGGNGNFAGSAYIMFGNQDGTFQAPQSLGPLLGSSSQSVVADLNGDGKPDLAMVASVALNITGFNVILNTPGSTGLTLLPQAYDFGNLTEGSTALSTTITIGNPGTAALNITNPALDDTTDFSFTNNCTAPVQPNATCTLTATFNPQSLGTKTAKLTFTSGDPLAGANYIRLGGTEINPVYSAAPTSLAFSYQQVGTTSSSQAFTVTNSGVGPLVFSSIAVQGDFQQTNNCPASPAGLAAGSSCTVTVVYAPQVPGSEAGRVTFTTNAQVSQSSELLTGIGYVTGPVLSLTPTSLSFGSQYVGTSSAPGVVTVQNTGDAPFSISSVTATAAFVPLSTCGNSVQPAASCAIGIFFDPATTGDQTGSLTIVDNLASSPETVTLSGTGTEITVGAAGGSSTSADVTSGQAATYNMSLSPVSGYTGKVSLQCTGLPSTFSCALSNSSVTISGSGSSSVTVTVTQGTSASAAQPGASGPGGSAMLVLACPLVLIFLGMGAVPRWRRRWLAIGVLVIAVACVTSCSGSHSSQTTPTPTPTPSQTYVFLLQSQPASGVTISTPLTLTVQQ